MAHHLIFIGSSCTGDGEVLKRLGLEDHIAGMEASQLAGEQSPDGEPGNLYAWRAKGNEQMVVNKDKQTWVKSASGYWVGIWNESPPSETELRRPYMQNGVWLEFGEEKKGTWKLPTPATIDQKLALSDDGNWKYLPIRQLAWYSEEMSKRRAGCEIIGDGDEAKINVSFDVYDATALIVRALRINYRITPEVCHLLDLFTERNITNAYGKILGLTLEE